MQEHLRQQVSQHLDKALVALNRAHNLQIALHCATRSADDDDKKTAIQGLRDRTTEVGFNRALTTRSFRGVIGGREKRLNE